MDYKDQLKDERWLRKRYLILIRDNHSCQMCGYLGDGVNVHHKKYTGKAWDAPADDLITLCRECHSKLHLDKVPVGKTMKEFIGLWLRGL